MTAKMAKAKAELAAQVLRNKLAIPEGCIGLMLGTGWGDALELDELHGSLPFEEIQGFGQLEKIEGHERRLEVGRLGGKNVIALRGRVHLNEHPTDPAIPEMVRLQVQMLMELGVRDLIVTSAAGSLDMSHDPLVTPGTVVAVSCFMSLFAPPMPLFAGEFCSPEDVLDSELRIAALRQAELASDDAPGRKATTGGFAMVRGPFFEGRMLDKRALHQTGAMVVGMSMLPEACIVALHPDARMIGFAYVSNTAKEAHSHDLNRQRAKSDAEFLADVLTRTIGDLTD